jgi:hypothetical protein
MPDEPEDTGYRRFLFQQVKKKNAERRAQDAADAAVEWMTYPAAVQFILPVLFGRDWVGFPPEREHVVLKIGEAHPDWRRHSFRERERDEQIARAERWLLVNGLIEERRGRPWVQTARLNKALADDANLRSPGPMSNPEPTELFADKADKPLPATRAVGAAAMQGFVAEFVAAPGGSLTKRALWQRWTAAGHRGRRDGLFAEFDRQMGGASPGRGRPRKSPEKSPE